MLGLYKLSVNHFKLSMSPKGLRGVSEVIENSSFLHFFTFYFHPNLP